MEMPDSARRLAYVVRGSRNAAAATANRAWADLTDSDGSQDSLFARSAGNSREALSRLDDQSNDDVSALARAVPAAPAATPAHGSHNGFDPYLDQSSRDGFNLALASALRVESSQPSAEAASAGQKRAWGARDSRSFANVLKQAEEQQLRSKRLTATQGPKAFKAAPGDDAHSSQLRAKLAEKAAAPTPMVLAEPVFVVPAPPVAPTAPAVPPVPQADWETSSTGSSASTSSAAPALPGTPRTPTVTTPATRGQKETDPQRLRQRQKQIDLGKQTEGYKRYTAEVPRSRRRRQDPQTPDRNQKCSKRSWDGQVSKWRRLLHKWDPEGTPAPAEEAVSDGHND